MKKVKKNSRISVKEKLLYFTGIMSIVLTVVIKIFCGASIGHLNLSVEKARYEINEQSKRNQSLTMKVNELTSFNNIKDSIKDMGLAYNNDNIIVIDE